MGLSVKSSSQTAANGRVMHYLEIHSKDKEKSLLRLPPACGAMRHCGAAIVFMLYWPFVCCETLNEQTSHFDC
jgi:hypothetical protein